MDFLLWLQSIRTPMMQDIALFISLLCDKILLISIFCYLYWCANKKRAYGLAFSYVLSGLLVQGIKLTLRIERPFVRDVRIKPSAAAIETATGYSFPSGHTQTAASLLGYTAFSVKSIVSKILCFIMILLIMLSRMMLGVHTPEDVTVSFLITIAVVCLVKLAEKLKLERYNRIIAPIGAVLSAGLLISSVVLVVNKTVTYALAHDCIVMSVCSLTFIVCWFIEKQFINFDPGCVFVKTGGFASQLLKFAVGMAGLLAVYVLFGLPGGAVFACLKYSAVFVWICCIYPLIIKKYGKRN